MDSTVVARELREHVWPDLRAVGFSRFTSRVAWRCRPEQIDVIDIASFGAHGAENVGVTSFSFTVSIGTALSYVPPLRPYKAELPSEAECQFRSCVFDHGAHWWSKKGKVWSVARDGSNLPGCIQRLRHALPAGLRAHDALSDKAHVLRILQTQNEEAMEGLWGFGANPSPVRSYLVGYVARAMGDDVLARKNFSEAVASKRFNDLFVSVEEAINRAT